MEEIIVMINQVKHSGQNVRDVIPPDYLAILEEAEVRWRGWGRQGERKEEVRKEKWKGELKSGESDKVEKEEEKGKREGRGREGR